MKKLREFKKRITSLPIDGTLKNYFNQILNEFAEEYKIAISARSKKLDPDIYPEAEIVWDMAERIENFIGIEGIADFIRNNKNLDRETLALKIIDQIIDGQLGIYDRQELADLAIRAGMAVLTEGMTVAPLDGIKQVLIKRGQYGEYLSIYYAGPIRSAGGTEAGLSIVLADYVRKKLGIPKFIASEDHVYRYLEELRLYERYVGSFQYKIDDEVFIYVVRRLPIEVTGVPTEDIEVTVYRDLPGVETNKIRGGAIRVINDGLIGKLKKILAVVKKLNLDGWLWLETVHNMHKESMNSLEDHDNEKIIRSIVIGRPVISLSDQYPSFRIRYGREANMGISAVGIHPLIFPLLDYFIVIGSQLKIDLPGKAAIVVPCNICDPPIVELNDGSVVGIKDISEFNAIKNNIKKVLWLGDILISYGDFLENNHRLLPSPYVPEWWIEDLKDAVKKARNIDDKVNQILTKIFSNNITPSYEESKILSTALGVPMHPYYTPRLYRLSVSELLQLFKLIEQNTIIASKDEFKLRFDLELHRILKKLLITFNISNNTIIIISSRYSPLFKDLHDNLNVINMIGDPSRYDVPTILHIILGITFRDTEGWKLSARLGRPEKAKPRQMSPSVHVLFPVGEHGGSQRDLIKAMNDKGIISVDLGIRYCPKCKEYTYLIYCEKCGTRTRKHYYCPNCKIIHQNDVCPKCGRKMLSYKRWVLNIKNMMLNYSKKFNYSLPKKLKGVKGLLNEDYIPEHPIKGFIRSKYGITIFKDGTVRVDITNAPLHKFKVSSIETDIHRLKELGYNVNSSDDIIDLFPQDIIIPKSMAVYLLKVSQYIDELLEKVYGVKPYYNLSSYKDLIGKLVVGLSPHTSVGVIGRIIGFTDAQVVYASPIWHAAKRRDCDGDQDSIILLLDALINFSKKYLPKSPGGRMDAPLYINPIVHPDEVDTQVHNMDIVAKYPKEFYEATAKSAHPNEVKELITCIGDVLGSERSYYNFKSFSEAFILSLEKNINKYSTIKTMKKKLESQMKIIGMIFNEDAREEIVNNLVDHHIIRDISGNLRAFATQSFRCRKCNKLHRRIPLDGKCDKCGAELIPTISVKSVSKYLPYALDLTKTSSDKYIKSKVSLLEKEINKTLGYYRYLPTTIEELIEGEEG